MHVGVQGGGSAGTELQGCQTGSRGAGMCTDQNAARGAPAQTARRGMVAADLRMQTMPDRDVAHGMKPTFAGSIFNIGGVDGVPRLIQVFEGEVGHLLQTFNIRQGDDHQIACSSTATFQTWQAAIQARLSLQHLPLYIHSLYVSTAGK